jgi:hypothetical protein
MTVCRPRNRCGNNLVRVNLGDKKDFLVRRVNSYGLNDAVLERKESETLKSLVNW